MMPTRGSGGSSHSEQHGTERDAARAMPEDSPYRRVATTLIAFSSGIARWFRKPKTAPRLRSARGRPRSASRLARQKTRNWPRRASVTSDTAVIAMCAGIASGISASGLHALRLGAAPGRVSRITSEPDEAAPDTAVASRVHRP
jgi:hypothetical protein